MNGNLSLADFDIIPGTVVDSADPNKLCRVKCAAPGLCSTETMEKEALPWVYRFPMCGYQQYSRLLEGSKVWILHNVLNEFEYWYVPYSELNANTIAAIGNSEESEVLISRSFGSGDVQIYFNNDEGHVTKIGDNYDTITMKGDIINMSNGSSVKIVGKHVYQGIDEGEYEPAVLGDKLKKLFEDMSSDLDNLATVCRSSPYTTHLEAPLQKLKLDLDKNRVKILSQNCSLD